MNRLSQFLFLFGLLSLSIFASTANTQETQQWAQWRGPNFTGANDNADPPIRWSESENIKWKTALPGIGHSSPVVTKELVLLTTAVATGEKFEPIADNRPGSHDNLKVSQRHKYVVLAIDRANGKIKWQTNVNENVPHEGAHYTGSLASASPATDGKYVYASFGSHGIFCLDLDGKVIWKKELGKMHSKHGHGEGTTPVLHDNKLIVNWDHEDQSFIVAFNAKDGSQAWRKQREEVTSWSSPIIATVAGKAQVIVAGSQRVRGYDLQTGNVVWECGGLSNNVCATPVVENGIVVVGSSYEKKAMFAIKLEGASGDITNSDHVLWSRAQRTPYVPSPLLYRGKVYFLRHYQGVLSQVDAKSGQELNGPFRLNGLRNIYSSPVAAADRVYVTDREGVTLVMSHSEMPRLLSANQLNDSFSASPALVGNEMFLRGEKHIYCIATKTP